MDFQSYGFSKLWIFKVMDFQSYGFSNILTCASKADIVSACNKIN
jgi:hypothetical protein